MENATKPFNICDTLRRRLNEITDLKEAAQTKINSKNEQLQKLYSKSAKGSRATPTQLDAKIDELETRRTSSSLALSEEKEILRQIAQINKAKLQYEVNKAHEKVIQERKSELNKHRTDLTKYKAQIAELEAALSKVELAARLGCTANDLTSFKIDCPLDKLGQVIGKGGSNIKKLESKTGCLIDLDKVKSQIHLQGNESSIQKAITEIENITLSIDVEMDIGEALFSFYFSKQLSELSALQKKHPNVTFDLSKETRVMKLRGREEFVTPAKEDVMNVNVKMEKMDISAREAALIVGKGGKTINRITEQHGVSIQIENQKNSKAVDDGKSVIMISGNGMKVDLAVKEIKDILFNNEDIEVSILVSAMTRNRLLSNGGGLVKQLQKDVNKACQPGNSFVRFEEMTKGEERDSSTILIVKSARMHIEKAEAIVKEKISSFDSNLVTIQIDVDLVPVIIGSKGATIKSLKKLGGQGADIDVDKFSGEVKLMADTESQRDAMKTAIDDLVNENQILRVPMDSAMFPDLFGQTGRAVKGRIQKNGVFLKIDDSNSAILLRGSIEKITEAAEDVRQFIARNQSSEFSCDSADQSFLSRHISFMRKMEKEFGVKISMSNTKQGLIVIRGKRDSIASAQKELNKILHGGDGFAVEKLFVPVSILGSIIGKAGKNISKYESDHPSVMVNVHSLTNSVSIRGPPEQVELCKGVITKDILDCNTTESIKIDAAVHEKLSKPGALSKLLVGLNVNVTLTDSTIRLRGCFSDVEELKMLINDLVSGVYKSVLRLIPDNFNFVSKQMELSKSQFEEITEPTETSIVIDSTLGAIVVEGKRSSVKRAKSLLVSLLETLLPSRFSKTKFLKPLLKSMGSSKNISSLGKETRCFISLERDICTFIVQASTMEILKVGMAAVSDKVQAIMKLSYVTSVESWLIQHLLAKAPQDVEKIQTDTKCEISLIKSDAIISIVGKEESKVAEAKVEIEKIMDQAKKENYFIDLPESSMNMFVGTSGKNMKSMASTYGVTIERVKKTRSRIRIQGKDNALRRASTAVEEWLSKWEKKNVGLTVAIDHLMLMRLEKDSSILNEIQREFGVKIDLNRNNFCATIRGGQSDDQAAASEKLESILYKENEVETEECNMGKENAVNLPQAISKNETLNISSPQQQTVVNVSFEQTDNVIYGESVSIDCDSNIRSPSNNAVGNLYNLLVSDDVAQHWDSSTVSTKIENENESPTEPGVSYYRSASGFHIRL